MVLIAAAVVGGARAAAASPAPTRPTVGFSAPGCNVAPMRGGSDEIFCGDLIRDAPRRRPRRPRRIREPERNARADRGCARRAAVPLAGVVQYGRIDAARTLSGITARSTAVFRGAIDAGARARIFTLLVAAGRVTATLTFRGRRRLALSLFLGDASRPLAQFQGRSPVRMARELSSGTIRLVVSGAPRASFVLTVSYAR